MVAAAPFKPIKQRQQGGVLWVAWWLRSENRKPVACVWKEFRPCVSPNSDWLARQTDLDPLAGQNDRMDEFRALETLVVLIHNRARRFERYCTDRQSAGDAARWQSSAEDSSLACFVSFWINDESWPSERSRLPRYPLDVNYSLESNFAEKFRLWFIYDHRAAWSLENQLAGQGRPFPLIITPFGTPSTLIFLIPSMISFYSSLRANRNKYLSTAMVIVEGFFVYPTTFSTISTAEKDWAKKCCSVGWWMTCFEI